MPSLFQLDVVGHEGTDRCTFMTSSAASSQSTSLNFHLDFVKRFHSSCRKRVTPRSAVAFALCTILFPESISCHRLCVPKHHEALSSHEGTVRNQQGRIDGQFCEYDTSVNMPVSAQWPEGMKPPVPSQTPKPRPSPAHSTDHQINKIHTGTAPHARSSDCSSSGCRTSGYPARDILVYES